MHIQTVPMYVCKVISCLLNTHHDSFSVKYTYGGLTRYSLVFVLLYWYWEIVVDLRCKWWQINENSLYTSISCVSFCTPLVAYVLYKCSCKVFFIMCTLFVPLILLTHQNGWNCLHMAACGGHLDIVKDLVDQHHMNISTKTNVRRSHESYKHCTHMLYCCYVFYQFCIFIFSDNMYWFVLSGE